jgi:RNA polymerase sigma-70 factor (ECF subfamily)
LAEKHGIHTAMSESQGTQPYTAINKVPPQELAKLFVQAGAERFGLTRQDFADILDEIVNKYLGADVSLHEVSKFLSNLHLEELVLARACAQGHEAAWELFLARYRERLYNSAYAIAREESAGRELADSLYADLYGTRTKEGRRISKLASFTGRGSLEGWLRAVLAQEYVNRFRHARGQVSMEEQIESGRRFEPKAPAPSETVDLRLEEATDQALAALPSEDKLILTCYYLDGRTLAEIARLLEVHESTMSRKVERITQSIRKAIRAGLVKRGMSSREAELAMEIEVSEISLDVRKRLVQEKG